MNTSRLVVLDNWQAKTQNNKIHTTTVVMPRVGVDFIDHVETRKLIDDFRKSSHDHVQSLF